jgi:hypothetical protein
METLRQASLFALLTLVLDFVPLVIAIAYVIRPSEQRLALVRPLFLAGFFAGATGTTLGFLNLLVGIGTTQDLTLEVLRRTAIGAAESLVPLIVGFGCLTVAWLLVAAGMARQDARVP